MMLMQEKKQVRALRRSSSNLSTCKKIFSYYQLSNLFSEIIWCEGDINDIPSLEENMKDCDIVIHAAALVSFQKSDLDLLNRVANQIEGHCICALGDAAAMPVKSFLTNFWNEFEYYVEKKQSMII